MIRKRKRVHRKAKKSDNPVAWQNYRQIRNNCTYCVRKARKDYDEKLSSNLSSSTNNPKEWWNNANKLLNKTQNKKTIPSITFSNTVYDNDNDKATIFNDFFCKQSKLSEVNASIPFIQPNDLPPNTLSNIDLQCEEVKSVLESLDITKATGPDHS